MNIIRILILTVTTSPLFAQSKEIKDFENNFCKEYKRINSLTSDFEKHSELMSKFATKTEKFIQTHPETLSSPLKKVAECINISTSEDKLLRVYSWDVETGGTARAFDNIIQFKSNNKVYTIEPSEENMGDYHEDIHSIKLGTKTYYLIKTLSIGSTRDHSIAIKAYIIQGKQLKPVQDLFISKTQSTGKLDFWYDNGTLDESKRKSDLIYFDPKTKKLYVAVVDEFGKISNKNIVYSAKGDKFVFTGFEKAN